MTVETRYMRNDQQTVNGLTAYKLGTSQTTTARTYDVYGTRNLQAGYWASDVAVRHSDGSETSLGVKVAQVSRSAQGSGLQSATWDCPQTSLALTDAVVVRVYLKIGTGAWQLAGTFITEQLNGLSLDAATWTFYYYTFLYYDDVEKLYEYIFAWGESLTYNSRITNFTWTPAVVAIASKRLLVGVGI